MQEKQLVGFVIYNKHNQFLLTRTVNKNTVDFGLVCKEVKEEINATLLNSIIKENLCLNINFAKQAPSVLVKGTDTDGSFTIYSLELNTSANSMFSLLNAQTEFLWLTYKQINKLFNEKKLNVDQLTCISKCYEQNNKEQSLIKEKVKAARTLKTSKEKEGFKYSNPEEAYNKYIEKYTDSRLFSRLINGRKIKPCGRECVKQGYLIAQNWHHSSFENFTELMDDENFILSAAEITPNPVECGNYFYMYVNEHLKAKSNFRLKFLKAVYNNLNVYKLEDINLIVEELNLKAENELILNDLEFKKSLEKKFNKILKKMELEYHCSGTDKKELHRYKVKANELKILLDNIKQGLTIILNSFNVGEKIEEQNFEPSTFYEYLCQQSIKTKPQPKEETETHETHKNNNGDEPATYYEFLIQQSRKKSNENNL